VVIMTSNVGSRQAKDSKALGFGSEEKKATDVRIKSAIDQDLRKTFSPEFLNRVDELIFFRSLHLEDMRQIVEILLGDVNMRLKNMDIVFDFTDGAKDFLCRVGLDPEQGARPLRRAIQKYVEDPLSEKLLRGEISHNSRVTVDSGNDVLKFSTAKLGEEDQEPAGVGKAPPGPE
ncbi:AAA family ATPase, partial [bacterium]|nr:AAA family ATPase [bacterium]